MICIGIDIGSVAAKAVVLDADKRAILSRAMIPTGWDHRAAIEGVKAQALTMANIGEQAIHGAALTGYGRVAGKESYQTLSEISCHAQGAHFLFPEAQAVIDIGGQDSKAILLGSGGKAVDFVMNDKCAAGTGRFISMVATLLGRDLEAFAALASTGSPLPINSMCAVFAESEIIGLLAKGHVPEDIAAGVCRSIARRTAGLAARLNLHGKTCVFSGGLAGNNAIATALAEHLKGPLLTAPFSQFAGALGAAVMAARR